MNKKKLYIGTIKKCLDSYSLEIFGEERYYGNGNPNNRIKGNREVFAKTEKTNAVIEDATIIRDGIIIDQRINSFQNR